MHQMQSSMIPREAAVQKHGQNRLLAARKEARGKTELAGTSGNFFLQCRSMQLSARRTSRTVQILNGSASRAGAGAFRSLGCQKTELWTKVGGKGTAVGRYMQINTTRPGQEMNTVICRYDHKQRRGQGIKSNEARGEDRKDTRFSMSQAEANHLEE